MCVRVSIYSVDRPSPMRMLFVLALAGSAPDAGLKIATVPDCSGDPNGRNEAKGVGRN